MPQELNCVADTLSLAPRFLNPTTTPITNAFWAVTLGWSRALSRIHMTPAELCSTQLVRLCTAASAMERPGRQWYYVWNLAGQRHLETLGVQVVLKGMGGVVLPGGRVWGGQRAPPSTRQTDRESSAPEGRTEKTRQCWDTIQERVAATAPSRTFGDKEAVCASKVPQSPPNSGPGPGVPLASPSPGHKRTEPTLRKGGTWAQPGRPPPGHPPPLPMPLSAHAWEGGRSQSGGVDTVRGAHGAPRS